MLVGNAQRHDPNNFPWNWDYFNLFMCTDYENAQISGKSNSWYNFDIRKNMGTKYVKTQSAIICFCFVVLYKLMFSEIRMLFILII